jgi:hypothetical protein
MFLSHVTPGNHGRRHTVGVFVGAFPCGTIVLFDELYGSEGIRQVYGILIEYLARLDDPNALEELLYDDSCHLKAFSEKEKNANQNNITKHFADLGLIVILRGFLHSWGSIPRCVNSCSRKSTLTKIARVSTKPDSSYSFSSNLTFTTFQ